MGRVGCFLNGCCYGEVTQGRCAVSFPAGSIPWYHHVERGLITPLAAGSLPVHPTQLYSALAGFGLLLLAVAYHKHRRFDGEVMTIFMVGYAATRFGVEAFRADEPAFLLGLTFSQVVSLAVLASGVAAWLGLNHARPRPVSARLAFGGAEE
jgi:phosphatidylglycerol:prolipoprotein diacylglycerol transferase